MAEVINNVYVIGVFDLFHRGHLELLKRSKEFGTHLTVAINSDSLVSNYKRTPFFNENDRLAIVSSLKIVDRAFIINTYDNKGPLENFKVDVIVHGDDWPRESYLNQIGVNEEYLSTNNIRLELIPYTQGVSTTELIKKIKTNDAI